MFAITDKKLLAQADRLTRAERRTPNRDKRLKAIRHVKNTGKQAPCL